MLGERDYAAAVEFPPVRALKRGGCVAVIAPSGPYDASALAIAIEGLRERFEVRSGVKDGAQVGYFASSDAHRLEALVSALRDEKVDLILCARGGFGATRIVGRVDPGLVREANKAVVGFSDVTALHAVWANAGVRSLHAPMAATAGRLRASGTEGDFEAWIATLEGHTAATFRGLRGVGKGRAGGRLAGGNLSVLAALVGTPRMPDLRGCVLFLEDVGERPYRIDRMLTQLLDAGAFEGVAAVALGAFTKCEPGPDGVSAEDVLMERCEGLGVPTVMGVPAGHIEDNHALAFGAHAAVDADAGTLIVGAIF